MESLPNELATTKTYPSATLRAFGLGLLLLGGSLPLRAEQFGLFTYVVKGGTIEVTNYPTDAIGPVEIPAEIAGKPVTSIRSFAFSGCTGLTSVTIPSSVTGIGRDYSDDGEIYYSWPAFDHCTALTKIVFLGNAPVMVSGAFMVPGEFEGAAPGFTIYYLSSGSGFTSPAWRGYPATKINETTYPAARWLLEHGLWYDADLHTDSDGDGVDLVMAYALDLDPRQNLQASLPVPVLSGNTFSLTFHATAPGVIYRAETSTGLTN